jgi:hypothetical protein
MKLAKWSDVGAITSAGTVAATIFCCLPFATGLIGASVAAFGTRIAPLQPYLIGLSLASLAFSFYEAYRPDPTCAGDACEAPRSRRGRRVMVWSVAAFVVLFLTAPWWADSVIYWTL